MEQITQKEFIKLIEEKQKEAKNIFYSTKDSEKDFGEAQLKKARLLGETDTYQTIICKLIDVEIVPERIEANVGQFVGGEEKKLLEPLCYKCGRTEETCPFHRIGSAYEDCSGFIEQMPARNDRFREFGIDMFRITIDAKEVSAIELDAQTSKVIIYHNGTYTCVTRMPNQKEAEAYYKELLEWVKYWKQM